MTWKKWKPGLQNSNKNPTPDALADLSDKERKRGRKRMRMNLKAMEGRIVPTTKRSWQSGGAKR